jgi:hypothetical protein
MKFKSLLLVLALTLGSGLVAFAQDGDHDRDDRDRGRSGWHKRDRDGDRDEDRDRDHDRDWRRDRDRNYNNNAAWQDGYRWGQWAATHRGNGTGHGRRWKSDSDRRAYDAGYRRGMEDANNGGYYGNNGPYNNGRSNHPFGDILGRQGNYPNNGGYGGYGIGNARGIGYNDGLLAGQKDRGTGHSFRPTQNKGYQDADKGYNSSIGDKNQYKQVYRDGFMQGYQRGYYGR